MAAYMASQWGQPSMTGYSNRGSILKPEGSDEDLAAPERTLSKASNPKKKLIRSGTALSRAERRKQVGGLLFDGGSSGEEDELDESKAVPSSKRKPSARKGITRPQRDPSSTASFAVTAGDNGDQRSTGVPRVSVTPPVKNDNPSVAEAMPASPKPLFEAVSMPQGIGKQDLDLDMSSQILSVIQINHQSLQEWFRTQSELSQRILQRQDQLEETLRKQLPDTVQSAIASAFLDGRGTTSNFPVNAAANGQAAFVPADAWTKQTSGVDSVPEEKALEQEGADVSQALQKSASNVRWKDEDEEHEEQDRELPMKNERTSEQSIRLLRTRNFTKVFHQHGDSCVEQIVHHPAFEYLSAAVIFSHSFFIGFYVEYIATVDSNGHVVFTVVNFFLTALFLMEVVLKALAEGKAFIFGAERVWNVFDLSLILLVLVELSLKFVLTGKDKKKMKTVLKIAEMARTMRILRIFRCLKFSSTLQIIIVKIFMSFKTLAWVLVLLCILQAVVAVCFTQGGNEFLQGVQHGDGFGMTDHQIAVHKHFGSFGKSMKTCFASISGGIMWEEVSEELGYISILYAVIFAIYIVGATLLLLSIITGIFINDMLRSEKVFEEEQRAHKIQECHQALVQIFLGGDHTADRKISLDEFTAVAEAPAIREILCQVGIDVNEAEMLFYLLDEDNSGDLAVEEFLAGCLHLMGPTLGLDMKVLLYENRRLRRKLAEFMMTTTDSLGKIGASMKGVELNLAPQREREKTRFCPGKAMNSAAIMQFQKNTGTLHHKTSTDSSTLRGKEIGKKRSHGIFFKPGF